MVATTAGASFMALFMAGSQDIPRYLGIGSGSGTALSGNVVLVREMFTGDRVDYTTRDHLTNARRVTWTWDRSSTNLSGTNVREFGVFHTSGIATGSLWNREGFAPITFDGSSELQIEITFEVFV